MDDAVQVDEVFAGLLADRRSALRPPESDADLVAYRSRLDAPMAAVIGPSMVEVFEERAHDVSLRAYLPCTEPGRTILFIHGGGFVLGSLATHDGLCRALAVASGARVIAVDYRLAPEHPFPAALDDCFSALEYIAQRWRVDAICGDSAGGHLAVDVALLAGKRGLEVGAMALFYPVVDPDCASASWKRLGTGFMLERKWMRWAWDAYLGGADPRRPEFSLLAGDLSGLPPTRIITAGADPLRDEGEALAVAITAAGGVAETSRYAGMIHGFASLPMLTSRSAEAVTEMAVHVSQHQC